MLSDQYLIRGLAAEARAIDHSWNQGHFGCAAIATYFLCRDILQDPAAVADMGSELDKFMDAHSALFAPPPPSGGVRASTDAIVRALEKSIDRLSPGGHNVIYAALALKALDCLPEMASPAIVDGIVALVSAFAHMPPREDLFGVDVRRLSPSASPAPPEYATPGDLATVAWREVLAFQPMYFEIQGIVGHLLTHAHSLVDLARLGYPDLSVRGHAGHWAHVRQARLFRSAFDTTLWTRVQRAPADPLAPAFWADDRVAMAACEWGYGHFFKYRYQFYDLLLLIPDLALRNQILEKVGNYVMNEFSAQGRKPSEFLVPLDGGVNE